MSATSKPRWYQFSLRMLLAIMTLSSLGMAWWNHRRDCLQRARFHAEQNVSRAREIWGFDFANSLYGMTYIHRGGDPNYSYSLMPRQTISGYGMVVLIVKSGKLPDKEKRLQAELTGEAEMSDQYFHAIWRPWERFLIDEAP